MTRSADAAGAERPLPKLAMLRELTDGAVLDQVFSAGRITRAELSTRTGISKPTISESVRRLEEAGLLRAGGDDLTGRRGRVATFYELRADAGFVLAVELSQAGVRARAAALAGAELGEERHDPVPSGDAAALTGALREVVGRSLGAITAYGPPRAVSVSVANPVDPRTREVIALPGSPFPEGGVRPAEILVDLVDAPVLVDNDVNLSALAERRGGGAVEAASFAYVFVGGGLGMSLYLGDDLVRGAHGLAGELGYLRLTTTASGDAPVAPLAEELAAIGFGEGDTPAIDVDAVLRTVDRAGAGDDAADSSVRRLGEAVGYAVAAACTVFDPELILLGGPLGVRTELLEPIRAVVADAAPGAVRVERGRVTSSPALAGALHAALDHGRASLLTGSAAAP